MSRFMIWSRVETHAGGAFVAVASAIPCNTGERGASQERTEDCKSLLVAEKTAQRLARELSHDIHARGGSVARERESQHRSVGY